MLLNHHQQLFESLSRIIGTLQDLIDNVVNECHGGLALGVVLQVTNCGAILVNPEFLAPAGSGAGSAQESAENSICHTHTCKSNHEACCTLMQHQGQGHHDTH